MIFLCNKNLREAFKPLIDNAVFLESRAFMVWAIEVVLEQLVSVNFGSEKAWCTENRTPFRCSTTS